MDERVGLWRKLSAKECSNYFTIGLISHASKVMLKILQARLQQYVNHELPDVQAGFRKGKGPSSQGYGFSCGHVWMWELDCEEGRAPKNWCFWTVVLEKTLESPLDCKEISPRISLEGMMLKLKLQYFGHLMWRVDSLEDSDAGRDWGQEEKGTTEDEMAGWHHRLDGREFEWTLAVGDGQGGLACCNSWGRKESTQTLKPESKLKISISLGRSKHHMAAYLFFLLGLPK